MLPGVPSAAHRSLPFGTQVRVENLANGRDVVVRINDRGPFVRGRVIDVNRTAAESLGLIGSGIANVRLTVVGGDADLAGSCGDDGSLADGSRRIRGAALFEPE